MPIMYTISETTVIGINFKKKANCHIYIAIVSAICNLFGNIILVPIWGAKGAAISTGLAYIVFFAMRTMLSNKYYKVKFYLGKLTIATILIYILALYSSFYIFNTYICLMTIVILIILCVLYKNVIITVLRKIKGSMQRGGREIDKL